VKTAFLEMGETLYSRQGETSQNEEANDESDDVIDAEFVESPK